MDGTEYRLWPWLVVLGAVLGLLAYLYFAP